MYVCPSIPPSGPQIWQAGPQIWLAGPQIWLAGPQIWQAGPQAWLAGPQAWLAGPQTMLDGPEGGQTDVWKISPFCRTLSPFGNAAQKTQKMRVPGPTGPEYHFYKSFRPQICVYQVDKYRICIFESNLSSAIDIFRLKNSKNHQRMSKMHVPGPTGPGSRIFLIIWTPYSGSLS